MAKPTAIRRRGREDCNGKENKLVSNKKLAITKTTTVAKTPVNVNIPSDAVDGLNGLVAIGLAQEEGRLRNDKNHPRALLGIERNVLKDTTNDENVDDNYDDEGEEKDYTPEKDIYNHDEEEDEREEEKEEDEEEEYDT